MNALHEVREVFDDRSMFLQVSLGMVSASLALERLLHSQADLTPVGVPPENDVPLYFVLGLVAFAHRVLDHAEAAARAPGGFVAATEATGGAAIVSESLGGGLLR